MSSVSLNQAHHFLRSHLSAEPQQLTMIGQGAWSRCFGYIVGDREYAIRFGRYIEDFQKDHWAARFSSVLLPIPEVQYLAYLMNAIDQLRGEAATMSFFSNGRYTNGMILRVSGGGLTEFGGHFHNENSLAPLLDIPGVLLGQPPCSF